MLPIHWYLTLNSGEFGMDLSINGWRSKVASSAELRDAIAPFAKEQFREIWLNATDGPSLCALLNGKRGWLMYLPEEGDAGFSSRNPSFSGNENEVIEYRLTNGQVDEYPARWSLGEDDVLSALVFFAEERRRPPTVYWHDDSM
jgi:hypothetical protein